MKLIPQSLLLVSFGMLSACVTGYTLVAPGTVDLAGLQVNTGASWNLAPRALNPEARKNAQVWTQDGLLLDRLIIIPGVPDGETVFLSSRDDAALPAFRADMLPNEIEELTESSIVKLFGEGGVSVSTSNLRPHRYGDDRGILFNLEVAVSDGPDYKGLAGSFIADDTLYLMLYFGAEPHYYDKHLADAERVITGARLMERTAG